MIFNEINLFIKSICIWLWLFRRWRDLFWWRGWLLKFDSWFNYILVVNNISSLWSLGYLYVSLIVNKIFYLVIKLWHQVRRPFRHYFILNLNMLAYIWFNCILSKLLSFLNHFKVTLILTLHEYNIRFKLCSKYKCQFK